MATKTINVRFQLENQSEFKAKLTELNTALAVHKSEVALVSVKYNDSTGTSEALQQVIDTQKAKRNNSGVLPLQKGLFALPT